MYSCVYALFAPRNETIYPSGGIAKLTRRRVSGMWMRCLAPPFLVETYGLEPLRSHEGYCFVVQLVISVTTPPSSISGYIRANRNADRSKRSRYEIIRSEEVRAMQLTHFDNCAIWQAYNQGLPFNVYLSRL